MLPTRVFDLFPEDIHVEIHHEGGVLGTGGKEFLDLLPQLRGAALVGIEEEDPIVLDVLHRPVLLGARTVVPALEEPHFVVLPRNLGCPVGGV